MLQTLKWLALKSQQKKSIAKMWGKGVFTVASLLWFSAICCSLPVCFAQDCALPTTFEWTSTGPLATPQNGSVALKDFSCVNYNGKFIVYYVDGQQLRELRRGHDDLYQLVSDGHRHPVSAPYRGRCADADLFRPEEYLGSHVRVGPVEFQLPDLDQSHQPEWLVGPIRSLRGKLNRRNGNLRQHERLSLLRE